MSLPHEERRALQLGYHLLLAICTPTDTPRVPKWVRDQARNVLRHHPGPVGIAVGWKPGRRLIVREEQTGRPAKTRERRKST